MKDFFENTVPFKRYAEPIEIARFTLFLASDDSSYSSDATHVIDGAKTISL